MIFINKILKIRELKLCKYKKKLNINLRKKKKKGTFKLFNIRRYFFEDGKNSF